MNKLFTLTLTAVILSGALSAEATAAEGLVLHLKFDEISPDGKTTPDASAQGRHAPIHGQPLVEGVVGRAMKFEGYPEQSIELGDLKLKAPATIAFWIKTRSLCNDRRIFSQLDGEVTRAGSMVLQGQLDVWDGNAWQGVITRKIRHDTWMHMAVVYDPPGKATGYLNGQAQETVKCGLDFDGVKAAIGAKFLGEHGATFNGLLDDFRIYDRTLSAKEIAELQEVARSLQAEP